LSLKVCPCRQLVEAEVVSCPCAGAPTCGCALPAPKPIYAVDSCGCLHKAVCACRAPLPQIKKLNCCRVSPCGGQPKCFGRKSAALHRHKKKKTVTKKALKAAKLAKKHRKQAKKLKKKQAKQIKRQIQREFKKKLRERLIQAGVYAVGSRRRRRRLHRRLGARNFGARRHRGAPRRRLGRNCCPKHAVKACGLALPLCQRRASVFRVRKVNMQVTDACGCRKLVEAQVLEPASCPCLAPKIQFVRPHIIQPPRVQCCQAEPCIALPRCSSSVAVVSGNILTSVVQH